MKLKIGLILLGWFGTISISWGQLSGSNIAEYGLGNIPGVEPSNVNSIYDQFNLQYKIKGFGASVRVENYYSNDSLREDYTQLSQFSLSYKKRGLDLKAGHFYETLGKGLLYRGYEIKNSVYENQIYRVKQGFYRDLRGATGSYSKDWFSVKALWGESLMSELPPTAHDRREDLVTAGEFNANFANQKVGVIYLQNENNDEMSEYLSFLFGGTLFENFDYYAELAHGIGSGESYFDFEEDNSYGAYVSLSYSVAGFGASLEFKDYHNLFIGSGISDPPTLVKEHSYKLLNRSTHVPYFFDESGMQLEVFIVPKENHLITLNHSRSKNEFGEDFDFNSAEYFAEWYYTTEANNQIKVFADYSYDDVLNENARYATGVYYTYVFPKSWSLALETEFQHLERTYDKTESFQNVYAGLVLNQSTKFSAALIWEFTNDNKFADLSGTDKVETKQHYPGINLSYKPNRKNTISLFGGKRRGGPACTSGICYEVLDFKGVELRWSIKI